MTDYRSGDYKQQDEYKSFSPSFINIPFQWKERSIDVLLEDATRHLGELNAYSRLIPDVDLFILMHTKKEATQSSRIEGTQTTIDEAVMSEAEVPTEKKDDWLEVQNYTNAMNTSIDVLKTGKLPLCMRLLKDSHRLLLEGARGAEKVPGEIRRSPNWIGGSSLKDAFFIPPHHLELPGLLTDLENFWHNKNLEIPHLIKNAISHYQFETIHPFLDGNGRIGRLLITLYMVYEGVLDKPTLYLSDFFLKNKGSYYDALTVVRTSNNMEQWIKFFLVGVSDTAKKSKATMENIIDLRQKCEEKIVHLGRKAKNARRLLDVLYSMPIVGAKNVSNILQITHPTANTLLKDLQRIGILKKFSVRRPHFYYFSEYMSFF